jgi:hypothetical protein
MELMCSGGYAECRLPPAIIFEPFRLRNGVDVFRGLRGVPLTPAIVFEPFRLGKGVDVCRGLRGVPLTPAICL